MYFTTSTIRDWIPILQEERFRRIVIDSLKFLINQKRIRLHGYVIMPNHLHLILSVENPFVLSDIFRDFHKFTSQQIIKILRNEKEYLLERLKSKKKDRKFQIWQTTHGLKQIENLAFFQQKLEYIHNNPCSKKWNLCSTPEVYHYSSAIDYILNERGILELEKIEM